MKNVRKTCFQKFFYSQFSLFFARRSLITVLFYLLIVICSLLLASCTNPFMPDMRRSGANDLPPGMGALSLQLGTEPGRTIMPGADALQKTVITVVTLKFTLTGSNTSIDVNRTLNAVISETNTLDPIILPEGIYSLEVEAFTTEESGGQPSDSVLVARGSPEEDVEIKAGQESSASVALRALFDEGAPGKFSWEISFDTSSVTVTKAEMTILKDGDVQGNTVILQTENVNEETRENLSSGYYTVRFDLEGYVGTDENDLANTRAVVWHELMHIYAGLESKFTHEFTDEHFHQTHWTVTFDKGDGSNNSTEKQSVMHGEAVSALNPQPTRDGHFFGGWLDEDGKPWNFALPVTEDLSLYAKWIAFGDISGDDEVWVLVHRQEDETYSGYTVLTEALDSITSAGTYTVLVARDQELAGHSESASGSPGFFNRANTDISLKAAGGEVKIILSSNGRMFTVGASSVTLRLENDVNLVGHENNNSSLVMVTSGYFEMNGGKISGNSLSNGGGVGVRITGGAFTMTGGEISGNKGRGTGSATGASGAGVYVNGGTFTMKGGKISDNETNGSTQSGGGVNVSWNNARFIMEGGEISGNESTGNGGGVFVAHSGNFEMRGGNISGNTAQYGGGVGINSSGTVYTFTCSFIMTGGEISGNTATLGGGGVGFNSHANTPSASFTMSGGEIKGNSTPGNGGGVFVDSKGSFNKSGNSIITGLGDSSANTAGGVGPAAYHESDPPKTRTSTAGSGVLMDSGVVGKAGGWDSLEGDGSVEAPYLISNEADLIQMASLPLNSHYILGANITMTVPPEGQSNWTPIGVTNDSFIGTFDGAGYTISNMTISGVTEGDQGLFGVMRTGAQVKDLGLVDVNINVPDLNGDRSTGTIAGYIDGGTIENCFVTGSITGRNGIGGLVGVIRDGEVSNSYTDVNVKGNNNIGGLVGRNGHDNGNGTVKNSYALGTVHGNDFVGGIAGNNTGTIQNCVALNASVTATGSNAGRVQGNSVSGNLTDNYARADMLVNSSPITNGLGLTTQHGENITEDNWNSESWWQTTAQFSTGAWLSSNNSLPILQDFKGTQNPQVGYPPGSSPDNPFPIYNLDDLKRVGTGTNGWTLSAHYRLEAPITLSGTNNWTPIGTSSTPFIGSFNGAGKTITGLNITTSNDNGTGMFAVIGANGVVENLGLVGVDIRGNNTYIGGLVGIVRGGKVENCYVTGKIYSTVSNLSSRIGGLVGELSNNGHVLKSYSTVDIENTTNGGRIGGLVGEISNTGGTVSNSYATGNVLTYNGSNLGGLVGLNDQGGTVLNSYATGEVRGNSGGGLVGNLMVGTRLENSVALNLSVTSGRVTGSDTGPKNNNYARADMLVNGATVTSTDANSRHGADITAAALETTALQNIFADPWWDGFDHNNQLRRPVLADFIPPPPDPRDEADFGPSAVITSTQNVSSTDNFADVLASLNAGNHVVNLASNVDFSTNITLQSGVNVSLRGDGNTVNSVNYSITIESNAKLVLRDITMDMSVNGNVFNVYGTLVMEEGSAITNDNRHTATILSVSAGGSFIMNGGEIYNCYSYNELINIREPGSLFEKNPGAVIYGADGPPGKANDPLSNLVAVKDMNWNTFLFRNNTIAASETLRVTINAAGTGTDSQTGTWQTP